MRLKLISICNLYGLKQYTKRTLNCQSKKYLPSFKINAAQCHCLLCTPAVECYLCLRSLASHVCIHAGINTETHFIRFHVDYIIIFKVEIDENVESPNML